MTKRIVGKFKKDLSRIEFYTVIDDYAQYTILEKHTENPINCYVYDNKTSTLGLVQLKEPQRKDVLRAIKEDTIRWLNENVLFFWADSRFVTEYGAPHYNSLIRLYREILDMRKAVVREKQLLESYKPKGIKDIINVYHKVFVGRYRRKRFLKDCKKELKIIW